MLLLLIIVSLLDNPRWQLRNAAWNAFPVCSATLPVLDDIEATGASLEVRRRAGRATDLWWMRNVDRLVDQAMAKQHGGRFPQLWGPHVTAEQQAYLVGLVDKNDALYEHFRTATRLVVRAMLLRREPCGEFLEACRREEWLWY